MKETSSCNYEQGKEEKVLQWSIASVDLFGQQAET